VFKTAMQPAYCYETCPAIARNCGRFGWMAAIVGVWFNGSLIVSDFVWWSFYVQKKRVALLRWVVERTFAWLNHSRRLSKAYERRVRIDETWIYMAMTRIMLNRLA
jgi:hypothetical protein